MPKDISPSLTPPASEPEGATPQRLAAIDLGSNSFHLLVANYQNERLQVVARLGEKVQLAAGLDEDGRLNEAAMQRALDCLSRFAPFLSDIESANLRVVGTNALRDARNSQAFIERAEAQLGHAIEIIAGREEARLIYLGAAHALAEKGRRLIVDIGGGSTEFIIGEAFEPKALESLRMGCVTFTSRFFADGELNEKRPRRTCRSFRTCQHPAPLPAPRLGRPGRLKRHDQGGGQRAAGLRRYAQRRRDHPQRAEEAARAAAQVQTSGQGGA